MRGRGEVSKDSGGQEEKTDVAEGGTHDNGLVTEGLVVLVDLGNRLDSGVLLVGVVRVGVLGLVVVEDATDEGGDEGHTGLRACNGLFKAEEQREVAVDRILCLKLAGSLDTLPGRGNLDEDAVLVDTELLVESDEVLGLREEGVCSVYVSTRAERRTLALVPSLSKEREASTSVETRPGTTARSSLPNSVSCRKKYKSDSTSWQEKRGKRTHETVKSGLDLLVEGSVSRGTVSRCRARNGARKG